MLTALTLCLGGATYAVASDGGDGGAKAGTEARFAGAAADSEDRSSRPGRLGPAHP